MQKNKVITVQNLPIAISTEDREDYICITDIAVARSNESRAADVIKNWMRNRNTLEFLGTWEQIYNSDFKVVEFDHFKQQAGLHTFVLSVSEWIEKTNAKRFLSKNNYLIQTDAIKHYIIPNCNYRDDLRWLPYAEEADLLNVALFGFTAKAWRESNQELAKYSNVRDYATINELTVLSNLETHNAQMIREGKSKRERFQILKDIADYQMQILSAADNIVHIEEKNE